MPRHRAVAGEPPHSLQPACSECRGAVSPLRGGVLSSSSPSANPVGLLERVVRADLKGTSALLFDAPHWGGSPRSVIFFAANSTLWSRWRLAPSFIKRQAPRSSIGIRPRSRPCLPLIPP